MTTYTDLEQLSTRPPVFSVYSAQTLWTDPHLSEMMLEIHLSQGTALASRPIEAIDRVVAWIDQTFGLEGQSVCDLGCGPGLYANRFASHGATVYGLDFSPNSIAYARKHAPSNRGSSTYQLANYLEDPLPEDMDLVTLIYCDLCPLSPDQRRSLLGKICRALRPGGTFILDVFSTEAFEQVVDGVQFERNLMDGFWSSSDYFAFKNTFRYEDDGVSLDRFTIIEKNRTWDVYNWLKFFSRDEIAKELQQAGFSNIQFTDGFGTDPKDETTFGVTASA
ncbi:MAG: class I SAM-dependent methyltransferase [Pseudomonadota bacterium]